MSAAARYMAVQIMGVGLPEPRLEHVFHPTRKWRFDFAWPDEKIAIEIEGLTPGFGRHQRILGYTNDCEKYSEAAVLGWVVIRATQAMVDDARAINLLERAFHGGEPCAEG